MRKKKKILVVSSSEEVGISLLEHASAKKYQIETVKSGRECLACLKDFKPDLVLAGLLLPDMHGVALLKKIKEFNKKIGVFIFTNFAMVQNYHAAMRAGADYFLLRPYKASFFFQLVEKYFAKKLKTAPFTVPDFKRKYPKYLPVSKVGDSHIRFWGTRGSTSVSGTEYSRYGGNSSCLEIKDKKNLVIIDAGTGIRKLGKTLGKKHKTIHLLLGHTHLDHIVGFPFFDPLYDATCHVIVYAPIGFEKDAKDLFTDVLAYTLFPVRLDDIQAKLSFRPLMPGKPLRFGTIKISVHFTCHPGPTLCFKVQVGKTTFGYVTDNEMLLGYTGPPHKILKNDERLVPYHTLMNFLQDCDFLIHEAQYTPFEYLTKVGWGHSSISNTAVLIKNIGVKKWYATHHDPSHTDTDLLAKQLLHAQILADCGIDCQALMAYDSLTIPLK